MRPAGGPTHTGAVVRCWPLQRPPTVALHPFNLESDIMGKYALAWLLGVPGIVLVLLFIFFR